MIIKKINNNKLITNYKQIAAIALGANLEEPKEKLAEALSKLSAIEGLQLISCSSVYLTKPVGGPSGQDWYHNSVALFQTSYQVEDILAILLQIEAEMGRIRKERWGPRLIDLDLIFYEELIVNSDNLILPHPRMAERRFVLEPLAEVAPNWVHPILKENVINLLSRLPLAEDVVRLDILGK